MNPLKPFNQGYLKNMLCRDTNYQKAFRLAVLLPLIGAAAAVAVGLSWDKFSFLIPPCMFKTLTGWNCLSCGATRATFALAHGDLVTAFYYHPLYIIFLGWLLYLYVRLVVSLLVRPYRPYRFELTLRRGLAIAAICAAFLIIRNLPFYRAIFY